MPNFTPRTTDQNSRMHGLASERGVGRDGLHELAAEITNGRTESTSQLSFDEANRVIERLGGEPLPPAGAAPLSIRSQQSRRQKAGVKQIVSASQLELMQQLWHARAGRTRDGLKALCRKVNKGLDRPRTTEQCNRVIEAIKSMNKRPLKEAS